MSGNKDRIIYRRSDGTWVNETVGASRASSMHDTQGAAIDAAKNLLLKQGGGELTIKGRDGRIRSKDTIGLGNDPNPPKDKEH